MTKTTFVNCNLFVGTEDEVKENAWFTVDDATGKITEVGQGEVKAADKTVDLDGQYVMSGLINAHTHIGADPYAKRAYPETETSTTVAALENLRSGLQGGVTYLRSCAVGFDVDIKLKRERAQHPFEGPGIMPCGRAISVIGGHGDGRNGENNEFESSWLVNGPDEVRKAVRTQFKLGAENIKLMATGGIMSTTDQVDDTELTFEEIKTAVEEAHSKHMTICAHAQGAQGIHYCVEAGVDSVEHGFYVTDEDIETMKEKGIFLSPTLIAGYQVANLPDDAPDLTLFSIQKMRNVLDDFYTHVGRAIKAGVKLALGTDAGTPANPLNQTWKELVELTRAGASNYQALRAAGLGSAELLKIDQEYGSLEVGKYADFLVLKDNPLQDVAAVGQSDKQVYQHGQRKF